MPTGSSREVDSAISTLGAAGRAIDLQRLMLPLALLIALVVRTVGIGDSILGFHPTRQLFSAIKARGMFYEWFNPSAPAWMHDFAVDEWARSQPIEPPVLEAITATAWGLVGREILWLPQLISATVWVIGALPVFWLASRISSRAGGWTALIIYLFLPFAIAASRSFQPDPLMVALIATFPWALMRWYDTRSTRWAVWTGLVGGAAVFVKLVAVFFVVAPLAALSLFLFGFRGVFRRGHVWLMLLLITSPGLSYWAYGVFISDTLGSQFSGRFTLSPLAHLDHYLLWGDQIFGATGLFLLFALVGVALVRDRAARAVLLGSWGGYLVYSVAFTYHTATHNYYQLPLIPLVAVSVAPVATRIARDFVEATSRATRLAILCLVLMTLIPSAFVARSLFTTVPVDARAAYWADLRPLVAGPGEAPEAVVGVTPDAGQQATYWGWFYVHPWPEQWDLDYVGLFGAKEQTFQERFSELTAGRTRFLVTGSSAWSRHPELADHLTTHFRRLDSPQDVYLFDLTAPLDDSGA